MNYTELTALVIEDDTLVRELVVAQLSEIGLARIDQAHDGMEALLMLADLTAPDIIVCDIGMAPMNGLEFAVRLRDQTPAERGETPIVFLTARVQKEVVEIAKQVGAAGYVVKPPTLDKLRDRIDMALSGIAA